MKFALNPITWKLDLVDDLQSVTKRWATTNVDIVSTAKITWEMAKVQSEEPSTQKWDLWYDDDDTHVADLSRYATYVPKKTSIAMSWTSLSITDSDVTETSWIVWTASSTPNWFIEVTVTSWNITFTSTASETCFFTYYIYN